MLLEGMSGTEAQIVLRVLACAHRLGVILQRELREDELLVSDLVTLKLLSLWSPTACSSAELARSLGISRPRMSLVLATLEKRGWIERRMAPLDQRYRPVRLTPSGAAVQATTERALQAVGESITLGMGADDRVALADRAAFIDRASKRVWLASSYDERRLRRAPRRATRDTSLVFFRQRGGVPA